MPLSDTQILVALVIALLPGILAFRLATELYKQVWGSNQGKMRRSGDGVMGKKVTHLPQLFPISYLTPLSYIPYPVKVSEVTGNEKDLESSVDG